jgi:hypothetical protein
MQGAPAEKRDDRSRRVWYLSKGGWEYEHIKKALEHKRVNLQNEKWDNVAKKNYKEDIEEKIPHIFLSRAPLTFGHSQLVIPFPPCHSNDKKISEANFFEIASLVVTGALKTFEQVFHKNHPINEEDRFKRLAESTYSFGNYIKTLVVRTSADEKVERQYKIHLVPYFKSHEAECLKRFRAQHKVRPDEKGGLMGWLGDRETEVGKWEVEWCCHDISLDDVATDVWKLPDLARQLSKQWPRTSKSCKLGLTF